MAYIDPNLGMPQRYMPAEGRPSTFSRLMEAQPSVVGGIFVQAGRGARTIMAGGGFMDDRSSSRFLSRRANKAARRYGAFRNGSMSLNAADLKSGEQFFQFGKNSTRGARLLGEAGEHHPLFYGAKVNTLTTKPRALRRGSSISMFSNEEGTYTYAQGVRGMGTKRFGPLGKLAKNSGANDTENILGPGLFAGITAGRKMDLLERKALNGSRRALSRLGRSDIGIERMIGMNNPNMLFKASQTPIQMARSLGGIPGGVGSLPASERLAMARATLAPSRAYNAGIATQVKRRRRLPRWRSWG